MTEPRGGCVVCRLRDPVELPACNLCRSRAAVALREIPEMCAQLASLGYVERDVGDRVRDGRLVRVVGRRTIGLACDIATRRVFVVYGDGPADPVAHYLTAGPIAGRSSAPRVSGSRDRGVPARLDLLGRPDMRAVHDEHGDQAGAVPVAAVLGSWALWWAELRREYGPALMVQAQCRWLADRLDWAFDHHPAVDVFAAELADVHLALRQANGLTEQQPELCDGVPCRSIDCDLKTLYRMPGSDYIECETCGLLLTEGEYADWTRLLRAGLKTVRPAA